MPCSQHCVGCAPGLGAAFGDFKALGDIVDILIGIFYFHMLSGLVVYESAEIFLVFSLYYDDSPVEACSVGVEK